jgi:hypothetical protein
VIAFRRAWLGAWVGALLALTVAAAPLAADWCAAVCETPHMAATSTMPSCHHTSGPAPRVSDATTPCSHDHRPVTVEAATLVASIAPLPAASFVVTLIARASPPRNSSSPLPLTLASALRI